MLNVYKYKIFLFTIKENVFTDIINKVELLAKLKEELLNMRGGESPIYFYSMCKLEDC